MLSWRERPSPAADSTGDRNTLCQAPVEPEWKDMTNMTKAPFANPASFVAEPIGFVLPESEAEFSVAWVQEKSGWYARVFLRSHLLAVLSDGTKPGWAASARVDGPLAKILKNDATS